MRAKTTQLSVLAVAALAIFAVAAVMLLAGGDPAQADTAATIAPDSGGDHLAPLPQATATPTPRFPTPEPCSADPAPAVDSGHIALFDVWWNTEELELTNSSCPPTVTHTREEKRDEDGDGTGVFIDTYTRSPSNINIDQTIIHIPSSHKDTLTEAAYPNDVGKYEKLWDADDAENPNGDGDRDIWALPACPPGANTAAADDLCLMFSAALLNSGDWTGPIQYHVNHVHQVDIDKQDDRYVLVYDGTPDAPVLEWNSSDARVSTMPVPAGGYDRPRWFFTGRGAYQFQVHITGDPVQPATAPGVGDPTDTVVINPSVNSDVREYIIHVGAEADLGVDVMVAPADSNDQSLDPGENVTITVTASNAGPDAVPCPDLGTATDTEPDKVHCTKVDVTLPAGLTYSTDPMKAPRASKGTYDSATGVWAIGDLAVTNDDNTITTDDSPTLTITATVPEETRGTEQKVKATISATETLLINEIKRDADGSPLTQTVEGNEIYQLNLLAYHVQVPDKVSGNNMDMDTVTVSTMPNVDPMFIVTRSIAENSHDGTRVGDPIAVKEPNADDTLTFSLTGDGADAFTVSSVDGGAQIAVAPNAVPDYETKESYDLTLQVSDGKDREGNADTSIDHSVAVAINVIDNLFDTATLTLSVDNSSPIHGTQATWTATVGNLPPSSGHRTVEYTWSERYTNEHGTFTAWETFAPNTDNTYRRTGGRSGVKVDVRVSATVYDADGTGHGIGTSDAIEVIWR